jgi:hypothetical protein
MESYENKIKLHNDLQKFQIEKSIVGSEAYNIEQDLIKGISQEEILEKARSGIYKPTKQNLKEGKVGQKYGSEKHDEEKNKDQISRKNEIKEKYKLDSSEVNKFLQTGSFIMGNIKTNNGKVKINFDSDKLDKIVNVGLLNKENDHYSFTEKGKKEYKYITD